MQELLIHTINSYPFFTYVIIVFVSFVEGPILAMVCGLLVRLGDFHFLPVYFALMVGDLIGDTFWYFIGYRYGHGFIHRYGHYFSITEGGVNNVMHIFHKYQNRILLVSKITMGFGFALVTLVTAGMVKIPFRQYLLMNVVGQFVWTGLLLAVGYWLGNVYTQVDGILGKISVFAAIVVIFLLLVGYGKYLKTRMSLIKE